MTFAEKRLAELDPGNRLLVREGREKRLGDLPTTEQRELLNDMEVGACVCRGSTVSLMLHCVSVAGSVGRSESKCVKFLCSNIGHRSFSGVSVSYCREEWLRVWIVVRCSVVLLGDRDKYLGHTCGYAYSYVCLSIY